MASFLSIKKQMDSLLEFQNNERRDQILFCSLLECTNEERWDYFKNFDQISPVQQSHLKKVYLSLCCALIASAAGVFLHLLWSIGGHLTSIVMIESIARLRDTPYYKEKKRVALLMAAALFFGASIGPLIDVTIQIDTSILISTFVGTGLAFACFLAAAMVARSKEYLYLVGLLSSGLSILLWLQFASSIFGGSTAIFKFKLYFWLLVFVGYIVVDTEDIIEKAHNGDRDYVKHAWTLFVDFVAVFVRILIIMLKHATDREEGKKKKKKKKRRD